MKRTLIVVAAALTLAACANTQQSLAEGERFNWR
jgi:predicted small secreted protein